MELAIVARRAIAVLEGFGLRVERAYVGTFLSALEMAGVSLSVLLVDDARLARLDAPTDAPAWPNASDRPRARTSPLGPDPTALDGGSPERRPPRGSPIGRGIEAALRAAADALIGATDRLTALDQAVGDGDLGLSLARGSRAVLDALPTIPLDDPPAAFRRLGAILGSSLGGTSGPLYAMFALAMAERLAGRPNDRAAWVDAFAAGCARVGEVGGAEIGDRTMLDALVPASDALSPRSAPRGPIRRGRLASAAAAAEPRRPGDGRGSCAPPRPIELPRRPRPRPSRPRRRGRRDLAPRRRRPLECRRAGGSSARPFVAEARPRSSAESDCSSHVLDLPHPRSGSSSRPSRRGPGA